MRPNGLSRTAVVALVTAATLFAAAWGNPGSTGDEFVFTPVPYTVLPAEPGETPRVIAEDEDGEEYLAAELLVLLPRSELDGFLEWLEAVGFEGQRLGEDTTGAAATSAAERGVALDKATVLVRVPRGAAIAARTLILQEHEVDSVDLSRIYTFQ